MIWKVDRNIIKQPHNGHLYNYTMIILSIIIIGSVGICCFTPATNSDYVEGLFWADASIKNSSLLNPDYIYPYAIPFGANVIFIPFVYALGISQLGGADIYL